MPRRGKRGDARTPLGRIPPHLRPSRGFVSSTTNPDPTGQLNPTQAIVNHTRSLIDTALAGFTLQDEARTTARRSSPWSAGSRLRYRPVNFVSTGPIEPLKQLEDEILQRELTIPHNDAMRGNEPNLLDLQDELAPLGDPESMSSGALLQDSSSGLGAKGVTIWTTEDEDLDALRLTKREGQDDVEPAAEPELTEGLTAPLPFFLDLDVTGVRSSHRKAHVRVQPRTPSPALSDSSEEIILFRGRKKASRDAQPPGKTEKPFSHLGIRTEIKVMEQTVKPADNDRISLSINSNHKSRRQSSRDQKRQEDEDLIADYIANMREHGNDEDLIPTEAYSKRDIGGSLSESESVEVSFNTITASGNPRLVFDEGSDETTKHSVVDYTPKKKQSNKGKAVRVDDALPAVPETDASYLGSLEEHSHVEDAFPPSENSVHEGDNDDLFSVVADRFANKIDDFDFMDWERPVFKRKKKGTANRIPIFNISDSELEERMQTAWSNDRMKKAEKKRERQALRAQGLLGKHAKPEDLRFKYPEGMGLDQITDELKTFLLGTNAILTLPPMNNHARKVIHELASNFNIKSKSTGSGDQRRPMLHRTFRTAKFAEEIFDAAIARVGRKYFPRNDSTLRGAVQRQSARRGGGGHANVDYRDGEVVGGSAPELGQENKGRAILEKMGWSSGTALGALNNKGILQPVAHVVKRSKAGLG